MSEYQITHVKKDEYTKVIISVKCSNGWIFTENEVIRWMQSYGTKFYTQDYLGNKAFVKIAHNGRKNFIKTGADNSLINNLDYLPEY